MSYRLPSRFLPVGVKYKKVIPGIDFPAAFLDELKSIGSNLYLIFHPFKVEYDNVMNTYTGKIDDPRFNIHVDEGTNELVMGWVLRNPDNSPLKENLWHIWQVHTHGFSHVAPILSNEPRYLSLLARRLYLQGRFTDKYGAKMYTRQVQNMAVEVQEKQKKDLEEMQMAIQEENSSLLSRAIENFQRGIIKPTNPTVDKIYSYKGQGNRSRIVRPMTDKEGGIRGFDDL